tara:strand:+ start:217 stop:810 length:594 start_codon:yes stop_codon:yes gene_type:complete
MVFLNTIITLGGLGAAYLIFSRLGGGAGIGAAIGSQIGDFTGALSGGITQAVNRFGNLVETPQANTPIGYRLDPTETRDYDEYVNYQPQSTPQDPTSYGETGDGTPAFIFPESTQFITPAITYGPPQPPAITYNDPTPVYTPPPAITYGAPLPPFAGTLEYVVENSEGDTRIATQEEKNYLESYGFPDRNSRPTRYS